MWLRRRLWRMERKVNEFLEGDLGWVRTMFVILAGGLFTFLIILIDYFVNPQSGQTWLLTNERLQLIPDAFLRWVGLAFTWNSLRYFLLPIVTLLLAMLAAALFVQDIYNLTNYMVALRYLVSSLFGFSYPLLRVEKGQMVLEPGEVNPLTSIGGPGYILISPGNAVLFERLKHPSSVRGQGLHFISRFESIKEIVDLTDQHGYIEKTSAMTKDGIVVTVHDIHFRYRLWAGQRTAGHTGRSQNDPYPFSVRAVRNMVYNRAIRQNGGLTPWSTAVQIAFDTDIVNYIRRNTLDAVTAPSQNEENDTQQKKDPRKDIRQVLYSRSAKNRFRALGAELLWFDIGHFSFEDPAVEEQRIRTWSADWVGEGEVLRAKGSAQRQAYNELARAEVQAKMVMSLVNSMHEAGLSGDLHGEAMQKMILIKTAQLLESLSGVYETSPNGE